jgi:predicted RNA-binding Zn-ribbon protein involved in translation (DUF1610 family)
LRTLSNYNSSISHSDFRKEAENVLKDVLEECRWMYLTRHSNGDEAEIICTVWSDVFVCPECAGEVVFWKAAVDHKKGEIKDEFNCPSCGYEITKRNMERSFHSTYDHALQSSISQAKQVPVLIVYKYQGQRFQKEADVYDLNVLQKIQEFVIAYDFPVERMPEGKESRRNDPAGITHVHQFYTKRNLYALAAFKERAKKSKLYRALHYQFDSLVIRQSKLTRFLASYFFHGGGGWVGTPLSGTLYIPSFSVEVQPFETWTNRINKTLSRVTTNENSSICTTSDASFTNLPDASVDYLFIDPPFGANISYSELSYLWESWLGVKTNIKKEAIENSTQKKGINEYRDLMTGCFTEAYRVLKPGRWMTVEFSNTKSAVWNSIQTSLSEAGFIVSNVSALDKKQGSFKAVTTTTAVKQDLVISAYKPNGGFEDRFVNEPDEDGVWDFIRTHLGYLPVVKKEASELVKIPERDPRILFDQVVAYFVRNLRDVPLSSKEFQEGLLERFAERDGMIFLPEQVAQYDKARVTSSQLRQLTLFVDDEASAIEWLRQLLNDKPQTYQDIHPKFIHELSGWKKAELQLELSTLLEQNFLKFDGQGLVPPQIHSHLSTYFKDLRGLAKDDPALMHKAKDRWYVPNPEREEDLQKLRERSLLKQFEEYKNHTGKKIKLVRMEAVRAGFKKAWQEHDYSTIIQVAEKIPENLLQEDQKLLMWYDQAQTRHSDSGLF